MPRNARFILLPLAATLPLALPAALPELSSIEPLEYDEDAQRLVARGDARLEIGDSRLTADRITYYREFSLADAEGDVAVDRSGYRLLAEELSFDLENSVFSADLPRTGRWPFYLSAVSGGGEPGKASLRGATLYYGEPAAPFGLSISSDRVTYADGERPTVSFEGATLRLGNVPFFYVPGFTHTLGDAPPYFFDFGGGQDSQLGTHVQTTTMLPVTDWLRAGANLDLYSKRGVLAGPALQYLHRAPDQQVSGSLSTGYINDQEEPEPDIFGEPIDADRGFAEWRHRHHIGERFHMTASASYWSDSEVMRDFRETYFDQNQQPDTFAEAAYAGDNFIVSAFGRFRPNQFQLVRERLPELRFDYLPVPVLKTGAYHHFSASYVRLREDLDRFAPALDEETESDRFDLAYRLERPVPLTDWLTLTPLIGARVTHYANQSADPGAAAVFGPAFSPGTPEDSATREIAEAGFDLEARAYATYPTVNRTWSVDGLRHLVRPVLRYRYFSDPGTDGEIARIDRRVLTTERPVIDLADIRAADTITETHLARLGVENLFQTRAREYGSRTLAALNFYQDILFEKGTDLRGEAEDTFNATWVELVLHPAPWLKFDLGARMETESLTLDELRTRTTLISGEIWKLGLSTDLLNDRIDQYRLDFIYRFNERYALLTDVAFDAETGDFTRTGLGLRTRIGSTWEVTYAVTLREEARREDDVEFTVRVRLAGEEPRP